MWWNAVACSFVIMSTQILAVSYEKNLKCTLYHLSQIKKMLLYMIGEIQYLHRPMIEILEGSMKVINEPYISFLEGVINEMEHENTFQESWNKETEYLERKRCYPEKAIKYLYDIPKYYIYDGSFTQLEALQLFLKELEEEIERIKEEKKTQSKVHYVVTSLAGVLVIILFI